MNIKHSVYKDLNLDQRRKIAFDALKRNDSSELTRIMESCPQVSYKQPDMELVDYLFNQTVNDTKLSSDEKIEMLSEIHELSKGTKSDSDNLNITVNYIHKRCADWPPKNIKEGHLVSDEFTPTRTPNRKSEQE